MSLTAPSPQPGAIVPDDETLRPRRRSAGQVTEYDFRRPIQLSKEHSRILQLGFDGFARQAMTVLTSALRTVCHVSLVSIEQRSYAEYIDSLPNSTHMALFSIDPIPGIGVLEIPLPATMACVDHMLGGPGSADQPVRALTEIESGVIAGLTERLLSEMRYALGSIVALDPVITRVEYSPQFAQVASAPDVMVVTSFEVNIDETAHRVTICLPFNGLVPHLTLAAAPAPASERERIKRQLAADQVLERFAEVPLEVCVSLRPTRFGPDVLAALEPGSVLRFSHPSSAPLNVTVDNTTFTHATAGAHGDRLAALIVGTRKENR